MVPLNLLMATRPLRADETFVVTCGSYTAQSHHELSFAKGQSLILVTPGAGRRHREQQQQQQQQLLLQPAARQGGGVGGSPAGAFHEDVTGYGELPDGQKARGGGGGGGDDDGVWLRIHSWRGRRGGGGLEVAVTLRWWW